MRTSNNGLTRQLSWRSSRLSYGDKDTTIRKFVTDQKLATMLGEDAPAVGAEEVCADAVKRLA